jgi:diacylglycerol kinase family enzyme
VDSRPARIACLLNASSNSGKAEDVRSRLEGLFAKHGLTADILGCDSPDVSRDLRQALAQGAKMLVAAGGDGTVNVVASVAAESRAILGVLPLGTLNHFAKDNGIPLELEAAVAVLANGRVATVDAGQVNDKIFVNNSSIGLYPQIVENREQSQARGCGKWQAFLQAVLYVFGRYSKLNVAITTPEKAIRLRTPFVFIGSNSYEIAGLQAGSRQNLDKGVLWVHGAPDAGRARLLWLALKTLLGLSSHREWHNFETQSLDIHVRRGNIKVSVDGEVLRLASPLRYRILPRALNVMVPASEAAP